MRRTAVAVLLVFLFAGQAVFGQNPLQKLRSNVTRSNVTIQFDSSGKMTGFPPAVIRKGALIDFVVKTPRSFVENEVETFRKLLRADTAGIDSLDAAYQCILPADYCDYKVLLDRAINSIETTDFCNAASVTSLMAENNNSLPMGAFIKAVFQGQYEVRILNGQTEVARFALIAQAIGCKEGCVYFKRDSSTNIEDLIRLQCSSCTADSIRFELVYHDPLSETVKDWYPTMIKILKADNVVVENVNSAIDGYDDAPVGSFGAIKKLGDWWMGWFWYSGGQPTLNPVPLMPESDNKVLAENRKWYTTELNDFREQLRFNDSTKAKLKYSPENFKLQRELQKRGERLQDKITEDSTEFAGIEKSYENRSGMLAKLQASVSTLLYSGKLYISKSGDVHVQKQFNAAANYQPVYASRRERERVSEIPENERAHLMVENVDSAVILKFDEKSLAFNDLEAFTKIVNDQLSQISASAIPAASVTAFNNEVNSFMHQAGQKESLMGGKNLPKIEVDVACENQPAVTTLVHKLRASAGYPFDPQSDLFKSDDSKSKASARWATVTNPITEFEAPYKDSVTIEDATKKDAVKNVATTYVKVGSLRLMQLASGVVFLHHPVTSTSVDTTGNGFKVSSSTTAASAIFGFKLYPQKNYNRDNSLIPRYPLRRLSVFGGFDLVHPLNDFYVGAAYDIVPGLSFIAGKDYYLQTRYQIENNQVLNTYKSYKGGGAFYAVTVNPVLFVQFVKLFFQ
jgi:hypothetical protein